MTVLTVDKYWNVLKCDFGIFLVRVCVCGHVFSIIPSFSQRSDTSAHKIGALNSLFVPFSLSDRRPGTEITTTQRPHAPGERRGRPAAGTHRTAATTAANRVRGWMRDPLLPRSAGLYPMRHAQESKPDTVWRAHSSRFISCQDRGQRSWPDVLG